MPRPHLTWWVTSFRITNDRFPQQRERVTSCRSTDAPAARTIPARSGCVSKCRRSRRHRALPCHGVAAGRREWNASRVRVYAPGTKPYSARGTARHGSWCCREPLLSSHLTAARLRGWWLPATIAHPVFAAMLNADPRPRRPGLLVCRHTQPFPMNHRKWAPNHHGGRDDLGCGARPRCARSGHPRRLGTAASTLHPH